MVPFREHWKIALAIAVLTLGAAARIASTYRVFNATIDEPLHISTGIEIFQEHRYIRALENPPLARVVVGALPYLNGVRLRPSPNSAEESQLDLGSGGRYWTNLSLARAGTLLFLPVLVLVVYKWAAELHGSLAGLAAVALVTFSPNVLAHAGLATLDFAAAATLLAAAYTIYRWAALPTRRNGLVAAVLCGLAIGTKFSALGLLPIFGGVALLVFHWRSMLDKNRWTVGNAIQVIRSALLVVVIASGVLWAIYGFEIRAVRNASMRPYARVDRLFAPGTGLNRICYSILEMPVPGAGFVDGMAKLSSLLSASHTSFSGGENRQFLLGETNSGRGWWYYFPLALAFKTTLPLLLMLLLAAFGFVRRGAKNLTGGEVCLAAFLVVILVASMAGSVNIGIRHILPIYPLAAIFASRLFAFSRGAFQRGPWTIFAGVALTLAHGAESAWAHPDYLAYFNESARGSEHLFLADSNLDWGQDVARLACYADTHDIVPLHVALLSSDQPETFGLRGTIPFGAGERPSGWIAVSVSYLQGVRNTGTDDYRWLLAYEPRARIGSSIWLYDLGNAEGIRD